MSVWLAFTLCLIYTLCVCVCVLQSVGSVSVPPDTGLRPTYFWGREDKREINCSTSSPASALLLREQFVGWHTREGMKGGGHSNDFAFLGDPVIQQWFPAVDLAWRSCPHSSNRVFLVRRNATPVKVQLFQTVSHPHLLLFPCFYAQIHSQTHLQ